MLAIMSSLTLKSLEVISESDSVDLAFFSLGPFWSSFVFFCVLSLLFCFGQRCEESKFTCIVAKSIT